MESRFIEGQTVDLSIPDGETTSAHTTSILSVSGEKILLRRPPELNGHDESEVVVDIRPAGDEGPPARGEIEPVSNPRILKVRCLEPFEHDAQRREMLRQEDELPLRFRFISSMEHSKRKLHYALDTVTSSASGVGQSTRSADDLSESESLIIECLQEMNRKFDRLVDLMTVSVEEEMLTGAGTVCDISGSGMRVRTDQPPGEGSHLEFRIEFPSPMQGPVAALGGVKRVQKHASPDGPPHWTLAVHFTAISESDRDRIVAHVLSRQRAEIKKI